ncbi:9408_t:CDS:1, partial [Funneliformis geosporum]
MSSIFPNDNEPEPKSLFDFNALVQQAAKTDADLQKFSESLIRSSVT